MAADPQYRNLVSNEFDLSPSLIPEKTLVHFTLNFALEKYPVQAERF